MTIPVLETERLRLRGHVPEDLPSTSRLWADPAVTRFIGGHPLTNEDCWSRLLRFAGHWAWLGFGYWAIEEKATGALVGEVGFAHYKRELESPYRNAPEIGWVLSPQHHGRGLATEAVQAVLRWGDANLPEGHTMCIIRPENAPSIRVAEKCNYRRAHMTEYKGKPAALFIR